MELQDRLQSALGESYTVDGELVGGGMSRVFVVHDRTLDRKVVVKTLSPEFAGAVSTERFRREVRLVAVLQQANIVPVLTAGEMDGVPYYVMPFVDGASLRARLARHGALDITEAVSVLRDVARALVYAHERGVIHRDIKPENVLLSGQTAVVTDFGIAKAFDAACTQEATTLTQLGTVLGTPAYMAPEQASGDHAIDHRADIYALGVLAYELLTGAPPFTGPTARAVIAAQIAEVPTNVTAKRPEIASTLARLVMGCLAKDPANRPQSAQQVLSSLDHLAASPGVSMPEPETESARKPMVAVLPFANMGLGAQDEFLSDGITEDIIAHLSQIGSLGVISRTSAMRYKKSEKNLKEIAAALGATHIIEGSVRRAGNRLRIVVQLIEALAETHLWAQTFDRDVADVFAIQTEVAEQVAQAFQARLSLEERRLVARKPTNDVEAYTLHLMGRFHTGKWSEEGWQSGLALLDKAIARDPSYAAPHATVAVNYAIRAYMGVLPPATAFKEAEKEARLAIALDASICDAHYARGLVHYFLHWDWDAARHDLERACELSPSDSAARSLLGSVLDTMGLFEAGMTHRRRAFELSPLDATAAFNLGFGFYVRRAFPDAIAQFSRALALDPHNVAAKYGLGMAQVDSGQHEAGVLTFERALASDPTSSTMMGFCGWAYAAAGRLADSRSMLESLASLPSGDYVSSFHVGLVHLGLAEFDEAFVWFDKALTERSTWLVFINNTPSFDAVRSDPRFASLLGRLNLRAHATPAG